MRPTLVCPPWAGRQEEDCAEDEEYNGEEQQRGQRDARGREVTRSWRSGEQVVVASWARFSATNDSGCEPPEGPGGLDGGLDELEEELGVAGVVAAGSSARTTGAASCSGCSGAASCSSLLGGGALE